MKVVPLPRPLTVLVSVACVLLGACGGGGSGATAADGVRSLDPTATTPGEVPVTEAPSSTQVAETEATSSTGETADGAEAEQAQEPTPVSGGAPGDLDGDGTVTDAELGQYANTLLLEFSACMRENGFPDFQDMTVDLFIETAGSATGAQQAFFAAMAERGVNLGEPAGIEALQGCGESLALLQAIAPEPGDEEMAEREAQLLEFAQCMREQGIEDWPDPDFGQYPGGGYGIELTEQFDIQSPEIQAAGQTCQEEGRGFFPEADGADG